MRSMTLLNETGDITIGWTEDKDEWVMPMIQAKMDAGYTFWIVDRRQNKIQINKIEQAGALREVVIKDEDARALLEGGTVSLISASQDEMEIAGRAKTAAEVASSNTVMTRPIQGG